MPTDRYVRLFNKYILLTILNMISYERTFFNVKALRVTYQKKTFQIEIRYKQHIVRN